jgi:hypothetical protein
MLKHALIGAALLAAASSAAAQTASPIRFSVQPYVAYGFYGTLPGGGPTLQDAPAYGAHAAFQVSPMLSVYGEYQRSKPEVGGGNATVDHWSAGGQLDWAPRQGASGVLPIRLEAGVGQVRYDFSDSFVGPVRQSDLAAKVGLSSAFRFSPNLALTYGAHDYISNFDGDLGVVNHIFVKVGTEFTF